VSRHDREWARLRALPLDVVLTALGVERRDDALICPSCRSLFQAYADPLYGISVACTNDYCRAGGWHWPEYALADLRRCGLGEARRCLLLANDEMTSAARRARPGHQEAQEVVAAFLS
jgi:hypothetical protein